MIVYSPLQIYLFESPVQPFNKYGISRNPVHDGLVIGCGPGLIEPRALNDDRDAVLLVQALSYAYGSAVPEELAEWAGCEQITTLEPEEFLMVIEDLQQELSKIGRSAFSVLYCIPRRDT